MHRSVAVALVFLPAMVVASDRAIPKPLADLLRTHPEFTTTVAGGYFAQAPVLADRALVFNATKDVLHFELRRDGWWMPMSVGSGLATDLAATELRVKWSDGGDRVATYRVAGGKRYWIDRDPKARRLALFVLR